MIGRNLHQSASDEAIPESVTGRIGKRNVIMNGKGIEKVNGKENASVNVNGTVTGTVAAIVTETVIVIVIESAIGNANVTVTVTVTENERETAKGIEIVSVIVTITVVVAVPETHDVVVATKAKETIAMRVEEMLAAGTIARKGEAPSTTKIVVEIVAPTHVTHALASATLPRRGSRQEDAIHGLGQGRDRLASLPLHRNCMSPKRRYNQ